MSPIQRLEESLQDCTGVYIDPSTDAEQYLAGIAADIRRSLCTPFEVRAVVAEPGFPSASHRPVGTTIQATCVAHRAGYWLVYDRGRDEFMCFWGTSKDHLSAPGIFGSPLYCWSA